MESFLSHYSDRIRGVLSCFDRILFKGYLPLGWPGAMEQLLARQGLLIKDFKRFVTEQSERVKQHAESVATSANRPFEYLEGSSIRKEDRALGIAQHDGIRQGLVCVFRILEPCQSFKLIPGESRPQLVGARWKCLCYYFYFIDRELGLMHIRIQSWFPLVVQICLNGHEWLARKLDQHGIEHQKQDNGFLWIADPGRAQRFADRFVKKNWPRILSALARKVNPLLKDVLSGMDYYWVVDQAEYATDVMFRSAADRKDLYENMLKHAVLCFGAEDVLTFLGRKLNGNFQGEVLTDLKRKRWPGARIKHRMCENWIKMYDKFGCVLRVETVINQPRQFKVRRMGRRQGQEMMGWYPMAKGVANLYRYREISLSANSNYLDALVAVKDSRETRQSLQKLARPVRTGGRSYRGFNPADQDDLRLFETVLRGEHVLHGFRNQDVRQHIFGTTRDAQKMRRRANCTSRLLKRLHVHGLIAKIPRSRRWRVTKHGQTVLSAALFICHQRVPELCAVLAA